MASQGLAGTWGTEWQNRTSKCVSLSGAWTNDRFGSAFAGPARTRVHILVYRKLCHWPYSSNEDLQNIDRCIVRINRCGIQLNWLRALATTWSNTIQQQSRTTTVLPRPTMTPDVYRVLCLHLLVVQRAWCYEQIKSLREDDIHQEKIVTSMVRPTRVCTG